ncbi:HPr kinase/phosphorylase [Chryseomicrobium excrementi]|uniref:HPr kinase/phosphorylase n=1 Tax=Chryseomicrobium excrementi TaxID=2041346 RepID=A0A2M9F128_9BACL|nr:HPr(Ser) kinase/phosphatase [Chryseomicrobium excrementi]PJK17160.1 HPr kinase/phosphorylase [Chryseomicrobium excrementi]
MAHVTAKDLLDQFPLTLVSGEEGIGRHISIIDISRPGLEMAGYFTHYPSSRIQLLGKTELSFFELLEPNEKRERMLKLCASDTPAIIVAHNHEVPEELLAASHEKSVPVFTTHVPTTRFFSQLTNFLERELAPTTAVHGVLVDIHGVGVLIIGKSGVGKSETALELVKRGHRLVADDCVEIRQEGEGVLIGSAPKLIEHLLEIRGLGIIDIMTLFGASAIRSQKRITLVIELELWDGQKNYDRLGIEEEKMPIIDSEITKLTVPVRPGRNLAVIIEVAAMNHRLKKMGMNAAEDFANRLDSVINSK